MKKLVRLLFALTFASIACGASTLITGTLRTANGSRFNGKIVFYLPRAGAVDTTCTPNPCAIVPGPVTYSVANGSLPSFATITANGDISPKGTYYQAALYDSFGGKPEVFNVVIPSGATFDIGTAQQTTLTTSNISLVNPAGLTANNTFTGINIFPNINKAFYVDGFTYTTVASAVNAAMNAGAGSTVILPPSYAETLTATLNVGSTSKYVRLKFEKGAKLTCNVTDGTSWCIKVFNNSSLIGDELGDSGVYSSSTFSGAGLIQNGQTDGTQAYFLMRGLTVRGDPAATYTTAMVSISGYYGQFMIEDCLLYNSPVIGLKIENGAVLNIVNTQVNGISSGNSQPVYIAGGASANESITWSGGGIQFPGPGQYALDINGNGVSGGAHSILFNGVRFEQANNTPTVAAVRIRDAKGVVFNGTHASLFNSQYAFELSESVGGYLDDITIENLFIIGTNAINNTVNSVTVTGQQTPLYTYGTGKSQIDNAVSFSKALTSTLATGTAPFTISSTTPVANLTTVPATYIAAGTQQTGVHIVEGSVALSSGTPSTATVTLVGSAIFGGTNNYKCSLANETTQANPVKYSRSSASAFVITGPNTVTDTVSYICVGN